MKYIGCYIVALLSLYTSLGVECDVNVVVGPGGPGSSTLDKDVCTQLCANKALHLNNEATSQCERGCRFFNIALNTNWSTEKALDLNVTKDQCCQACTDAYTEDMKGNCLTGCCEMMQLQKDAWLFYLEQQGEGNVLEVEVSLVSDPALWQPSYPVATDSMYKIPQTMLRTMPLRPELAEVINGKPWTPCAHTNEVPRWLVLVVALVLVVVTIYVSFLLPSRPEHVLIPEDAFVYPDNVLFQNTHFEVTVACADAKELLPTKKCSDKTAGVKLVSLNEFLTEDYHLNVTPPPKYSLLPEGDDQKV